MTNAANIELLFAVWERNVDTLRALNRRVKQAGDRETDVAQSLVAHLKSCAVAHVNTSPQASLSKTQTHSVSQCDQRDKRRPKIDKSVLAIGEEKRIRSKPHLRFVGSQPCLICDRTPSHAHHVRFAQAKGVALKVSDEFTVPLCSIHHANNHATGDERKWWRQHNIDPLIEAERLWRKSQGSETAGSRGEA
jgi:hypothetical protein